jgi:PA domain
MPLRRFGLQVLVLLLLGSISIGLGAQGQGPKPGVVAGDFTTYGHGFLKTSPEAAQSISQYFALNGVLQPALNGEFFHIGLCPTSTCPGLGTPYAYAWKRTNTPMMVGNGKKAVQVDSGVWSLVQALGTAGSPFALSNSATNPEEMGTGGILAVQALTLKINQGFSEVFVTPVTGFSGVSLVDMDGVKLDGTVLTPAQVDALNGQATLQIREATDVPLGGDAVPYLLSFGQLTELIDLLNGSFEGGQPSAFAQAHLYQPYITSNALPGERRPSTVSVFASKPAYKTFEGAVISVGTGCTAADYPTNFPPGSIALIERGVCSFYQKVMVASQQLASAAIIFNSLPETGGSCPVTPTPGSSRCEALVGMGAAAGFTPLPIPAAFVQRSTGLALRNALGLGTPVEVFVQQ